MNGNIKTRPTKISMMKTCQLYLLCQNSLHLLLFFQNQLSPDALSPTSVSCYATPSGVTPFFFFVSELLGPSPPPKNVFYFFDFGLTRTSIELSFNSIVLALCLVSGETSISLKLSMGFIFSVEFQCCSSKLLILNFKKTYI